MTADTTTLLYAGIHNSRYQLERLLPVYEAGTLTEPHHPHAIAMLYRRLGVCQLLTTGSAEPLFEALRKGVSAFLLGLPRMAEDDKVTSRAGVLWDALVCDRWDAAVEIARHSRSIVNPAWEHEDDFLYVWFLMTRYLRDDGSLDAEERQRDLLARWDDVLEGQHDPRRDLCEALLHRDTTAFRAAFEAVGDAREAELRRRLDDHALPTDVAAWALPVWLEGLALLRLAESDGLQTNGIAENPCTR
ncbi:MAG: hypothetical protein WBB01_04440 [Phormidesmis sp.]